MEVHSCHHCDQIVIDLPDYLPGSLTSLDLTFLFDVSTVRSAVQNGCQFFQWALVVGVWLLKPGVDGEYLFHDSSRVSHLELRLECCRTKPGRTHLRMNLTASLGKSLLPRYTTIWSNPELEFVAPHDSKLKAYITTRPIVRCPSSPESFGLASSWLQSCLETHTHAHSYEYDRMPARLLNVRSTTDGNLFACIVPTIKHEIVPYLALSYCCGGDQRHKTTKRSMSLSKGVVDVSLIPATIQDAILVTLNLGYKYLWVDSLCIIQDDTQDRTLEIAKMPTIYSNAICTIAASFPVAASEGFLFDRVRHTNHIMELRVRHTGEHEDKEIRRVHAYQREQKDWVVEEPLAGRGWALQERLLSVRVLEYRRNQVHFLCPFTADYDASRSDGWTLDLPRDNRIYFPKGVNDHVPATLLDWEILTDDDFRRIWYSIVEAYTVRALTLKADRTLAISGIAQRIATMDRSKSSSTYVAGHWLSQFPRDLLWHVRLPSRMSTQRTTLRPPTWAWTSVDDPVVFLSSLSTDAETSCSAVECLDLVLRLRDESAPYGDVADATLTIKGRLAMAAYGATERHSVYTQKLYCKLTGKPLCIAYMDARKELESAGQAHDVVLLLTETSSEDGKDVHAAGLVLIEEPGGGKRRRFSRLGCWRVCEYLRRDGLSPTVADILLLFQDSELETFDLI